MLFDARRPLNLSRAPEFRLNIAPTVEPAFDRGFSFAATREDSPDVAPKKRARSVGISVSTNVARLLCASQCLIVLTLIGMIGTFSYTSYRISENTRYYMRLAQPYAAEATEHGISILRNADSSSRTMQHMVESANEMSAQTLPAMAHSMNATSSAIANVASLLAHPTLKVSME